MGIKSGIDMKQVNGSGNDIEPNTPVRPKAYIFCWRTNSWSGFLTPFVRKLRDEYGIATILFRYNGSGGPSEKIFDFDPGDYAEIVDLDQEMTPRPTAEIDDWVSLSDRAVDLERKLGRPLNDILRTDRHYGIGFVCGATFMRSKFGHNTNYAQNLDILFRLNARLEPLFDKYRPQMSFSSPGSIGRTMLTAIAESRGIPIRRLVSGRSGKTSCWSEDWSSTPYGLYEAYEKNFERLRAAADKNGAEQLYDEDVALPPRPYSAELGRQSFKQRSTVKNFLLWLYKISRTELGRRIRGQSMVYGNYLYRDRVRHGIGRLFWHRKTLREPPVGPALPDNLPIVLYPLHIEPESTLFGEAQSADNQLAHIDMLAKTLPGGWYLVVKEHFGATSPRPPGFWRQVRNYPNVIVASTLESGEAIAEKSKAVAGINGTMILQTAIAGRPALCFLADFQGLCMPHMQLVTSYADCRRALERIRDGQMPDRKISRISGQAFQAANEDCTFKISDEGMITGYAINNPNVDQRDVESLVRALLESLAFDHEGGGKGANSSVKQ
jgi:hypothetical protein